MIACRFPVFHGVCGLMVKGKSIHYARSMLQKYDDFVTIVSGTGMEVAFRET